MPSMSEAGIGGNAAWIKAEELEREGRLFEIINAFARPPQGEFDEQIVFQIRFLDSSDESLHQFSLGMNDARRQLLDFIRSLPESETINGFGDGRTDGLILFKGAQGNGGRPYLFRDPTPSELEAAQERLQTEADDAQIPF